MDTNAPKGSKCPSPSLPLTPGYSRNEQDAPEKHTEGKARGDLGGTDRKYLHGHFAAVTASSAQLAVVSISPGPDSIVISQAERLGITAATGNVYDTVALQRFHLQEKGVQSSADSTQRRSLGESSVTVLPHYNFKTSQRQI